ncbi:hypothetical protein D3C76_1595560 [compost metagenome]
MADLKLWKNQRRAGIRVQRRFHCLRVVLVVIQPLDKVIQLFDLSCFQQRRNQNIRDINVLQRNRGDDKINRMPIQIAGQIRLSDRVGDMKSLELAFQFRT